MRKRKGFAFTAAGMLAASGVLAATSVGQVDGTITYDQSFTTFGESSIFLPDGVRAVDVDAIGGNGASKSNDLGGVTANGGRGAQVTGRISVTPSSTIWVEVGGNGTAGSFSAGQGGFNGGGDSRIGTAFPSFYNPGGGGGGASAAPTPPRGPG